MKHLIAALLLTLTLPAAADTLRLYGGGYSKHLVSENVKNESHDFGAVQYGSYVAGRFNNSHGRESYFAAYEWTWQPAKHLETFAWAGAVRGYTSCTFQRTDGNSKVCPIAVVGARWTQWAVEPTYLQVGDAATVAVGVRF
jgi:hypothetical protein